MSNVTNRLHSLRVSLSKARDCEQPNERDCSQYVAGLRSGLDIAVKAIIEEIKWAEREERDAKYYDIISRG